MLDAPGTVARRLLAGVAIENGCLKTIGYRKGWEPYLDPVPLTSPLTRLCRRLGL